MERQKKYFLWWKDNQLKILGSMLFLAAGFVLLNDVSKKSLDWLFLLLGTSTVFIYFQYLKLKNDLAKKEEAIQKQQQIRREQEHRKRLLLEEERKRKEQMKHNVKNIFKKTNVAMFGNYAVVMGKKFCEGENYLVPNNQEDELKSSARIPLQFLEQELMRKNMLPKDKELKFKYLKYPANNNFYPGFFDSQRQNTLDKKFNFPTNFINYN